MRIGRSSPSPFGKMHRGVGPVYIYIYSFSRHFYPKRLTVHSGYTFFVSMCVPWEPPGFVCRNQMQHASWKVEQDLEAEVKACIKFWST